MKNILNNQDLGNSFAAEMQKNLEAPNYKQLFKKAEVVCNCKKDCKCREDGSCKCKGNCSLQCPSCGKNKTIEAGSKIIQRIINASEILEKNGKEKQASKLLYLSNLYLNKLAQMDSNDVRMKDLRHDKPFYTTDLATEIEELDRDPDLFGGREDLFKDLNRRHKSNRPRALEEDELLRYLADSEAENGDLSNADDDELMTFLEGEDEPQTRRYKGEDELQTKRYNRITEPSRFGPRDTDIDALLESEISPETLESEDYPFAPDTDLPDTELLPTGESLFDEDLEPPTSPRTTPPMRRDLRHPFPIAPAKVPNFTTDEWNLANACKKMDKFFKKAQSENWDDPDSEDPDFGDDNAYYYNKMKDLPNFENETYNERKRRLEKEMKELADQENLEEDAMQRDVDFETEPRHLSEYELDFEDDEDFEPDSESFKKRKVL